MQSGLAAVGGRLLGRRFLKFLMGSCEFSDEVSSKSEVNGGGLQSNFLWPVGIVL